MVQEVLVFENLENISSACSSISILDRDVQQMIEERTEHASDVTRPNASDKRVLPISDTTKGLGPKSERTCDFAALILPRHIPLSQIPQYTRE